jgi:hypothetical protein
MTIKKFIRSLLDNHPEYSKNFDAVSAALNEEGISASTTSIYTHMREWRQDNGVYRIRRDVTRKVRSTIKQNPDISPERLAASMDIPLVYAVWQIREYEASQQKKEQIETLVEEGKFCQRCGYIDGDPFNPLTPTNEGYICAWCQLELQGKNVKEWVWNHCPQDWIQA